MGRLWVGGEVVGGWGGCGWVGWVWGGGVVVGGFTISGLILVIFVQGHLWSFCKINLYISVHKIVN